MKINEFAKEVNELAKEKGWWDSPREAGTIMMLMVSEIAEAMEENRNGKASLYGIDADGAIVLDLNIIKEQSCKPEGEAVELADCMIRIMDYFVQKEWDLEEIIALKHNYNKNRPYKHGGKKY